MLFSHWSVQAPPLGWAISGWLAGAVTGKRLSAGEGIAPCLALPSPAFDKFDRSQRGTWSIGARLLELQFTESVYTPTMVSTCIRIVVLMYQSLCEMK